MCIHTGNNCTFDNGGFCAWRNSTLTGDDEFDWTIGSGSTASIGTGPSTDHYGSRTGRLNVEDVLNLLIDTVYFRRYNVVSSLDIESHLCCVTDKQTD